MAEGRPAPAEDPNYSAAFLRDFIARIPNVIAEIREPVPAAEQPLSAIFPEPSERMDVVQEAFLQAQGFQCGFCTPGMIMTAVDLVHRKGHDLSDHTIREELEGNLCRCTGYQNIVQSIAAGAKAMANSDLA